MFENRFQASTPSYFSFVPAGTNKVAVRKMGLKTSNVIAKGFSILEVTLVKPVLAKACWPIAISVEGRTISFIEGQLQKACFPKISSPSFSSTYDKRGHESKANSPMSFNDSGIEIDIRPSHPQNAKFAMCSIPSGTKDFSHPNINVFVALSIIALQLLRESYAGLSTAMVMDFRVPFQNAFSPIFVTEEGIWIDSIPLHR